MTRACVQAVRNAAGDAFSEEDIDDFLNRFAEKARRAKKAEPTADDRVLLRQAAQELTKEQIKAALIKKRIEVSARTAREARRSQINRMSGDENQRLKAFNVGSERQGLGNSRSVDAEGRAQSYDLWGELELAIKQQSGLRDRLGNFWGTRNRDFELKLAKEIARLRGDERQAPSGDEGVIWAARAIVEQQDRAVEIQNDAGAWISRLPGYIARQAHDRLKVSGGFWRELAQMGRDVRKKGAAGLDWAAARQRAAARAFGEWRDFITPRLDARTFEGLDLEDVDWMDVVHADSEEEMDELQKRAFARQQNLRQLGELQKAGVVRDPEDLKELFLYRVWTDIVTGQHEQLSGLDDVADFRPPANKAAAVSKSRVLHFESPEAWMEYNERYARGSLLHNVMLGLERSGRNAALMRRWGPNPDAAWRAELARLASEARQRGDPGAASALYSSKTAATFDVVNGRLNTPENLRLAIILRGIRSWEAITKLGGIVLSKATDVPMTGDTFKRVGSTWLAGYDASLRGILRLQDKDARHAGELLHVGARSFAGHLGGKFTLNDGSLGWSSWATRLMYRLNAFEFVNEGVRQGAAEMIARHLGIESEKAWDALHPGTRETLERFGIDEDAWELSRHGLEPADDGKRYFTLEHLDQVGVNDLLRWKGIKGKAATIEAAERARADLRMRYLTMIHNVIDDATSEARGREMADMSMGNRAGTPLGEAARAFWQFKGFIQAILGRHMAPAARGYAGVSPVFLLGQLILGSTLAGYFSMNAKMIAGGQVPRPMWDKDPTETAKIWAAAVAQGGGLGIYGDFLFGEQNRQGLEFTLSSLAGPAVGDAEQLLQILRQAAHGGAISKSTGQSQIPAELIRLGKYNIPLVNQFYTRLAIDYLLLWNLQERVNPGYLQRYQSRVEQEEGRHFIVPPTAAPRY